MSGNYGNLFTKKFAPFSRFCPQELGFSLFCPQGLGQTHRTCPEGWDRPADGARQLWRSPPRGQAPVAGRGVWERGSGGDLVGSSLVTKTLLRILVVEVVSLGGLCHILHEALASRVKLEVIVR